jgi:hypothetical protein
VKLKPQAKQWNWFLTGKQIRECSLGTPSASQKYRLFFKNSEKAKYLKNCA